MLLFTWCLFVVFIGLLFVFEIVVLSFDVWIDLFGCLFVLC